MIFLDINVYNLVYTSVFLVIFVISYVIIIATRLESLFKQGKVWEIRVAQIFLALIIAYLVTQGIMSLVNSTQFTIN